MLTLKDTGIEHNKDTDQPFIRACVEMSACCTLVHIMLTLGVLDEEEDVLVNVQLQDQRMLSVM